MYSHPYSQITVETEFDNPIYETGVSCLLCTPGCLPLLQIHPPALWGDPCASGPCYHPERITLG